MLIAPGGFDFTHGDILLIRLHGRAASRFTSDGTLHIHATRNGPIKLL